MNKSYMAQTYETIPIVVGSCEFCDLRLKHCNSNPCLWALDIVNDSIVIDII